MKHGENQYISKFQKFRGDSFGTGMKNPQQDFNANLNNPFASREASYASLPSRNLFSQMTPSAYP